MMPTRRERVAEVIEGWKPAILLVSILGFIFLGFAFKGFGDVEAVAVGFLFPAAVLTAAAVGIRGRRGIVLLLGASICVVAFLSSEEQVSEVLLPRSPIGSANLSAGESLTLPESAPFKLRLEVHGDVHGTSADGSYSIDAVRGDENRRIRGRISRKVRRTRKGTRTNLHLTDSHDLSLAGDGPPRFELTEISEAVRAPLRLEVRAAPMRGALARSALLVCLIAASVTEALSSRWGKRVQLAVAVGMTMAFSEFVAVYYNPDAPLKSMLAALLFGLAFGGFGGWLGGATMTLLLGKRRRAAEGNP